MYVIILKTHENLPYMAKGAKGADVIKETDGEIIPVRPVRSKGPCKRVRRVIVRDGDDVAMERDTRILCCWL